MKRASLLVAAILLGACSPDETKKPLAPATAETMPATPTAEAATPAPVALSEDGAPPMVNGIYFDPGCPGEGCYLQGKIKAAYGTADLYEQVGLNTAVIAQIARDEWVTILDHEYRIVPRRGVVREGRRSHKTGDVVYQLGYEGEGCSTVWNKGQLSSWCDGGADPDPAEDVIAWDEPSPLDDPTLGLWVQIKRESGQTGWVSEKGMISFACTGVQDREGCPPIP